MAVIVTKILTKIYSVSSKSREDQHVCVSDLPKKASGRPLLRGEDLDATIREFVESMRKVGRTVNISIVTAAVERIVAANKLTVHYLKTRHLQVKLPVTSQLSHMNRDSSLGNV